MLSFTNPTSKIILSLIWGFGLATLFQRVCVGRDCIVLRGPKPDKIKDKVFSFNNKCYTYQPYSVSCPDEKDIIPPEDFIIH